MIIMQEAIQLFHFSFSPHNTSFEERTDELVTRLSVLSALVGFQGFEKSEHAKTANCNQFAVFVLALPIFPCSRPQSIFGANELNFCVRNGNRWTLAAINTNYILLSAETVTF